MKVSTFLIIATVLYGIFGLGSLLAPEQVFGPMGYTLNSAGQLLARTQATAIIGLAVMLWLVRNAENSAALRAILLGNAVYIFVEVVVLAIGTLSGIGSASAWGGVVVDGLLGVGFAYFYFQLARSSTA